MFEQDDEIPDYLCTDEEMIYDSMINWLVKQGYSKREAEGMTLLEFYRARYHANLEQKQDKWRMDNLKND